MQAHTLGAFFLLAATLAAQEVIPIHGSGFSVDIIAEKDGDSPTEVSDYAGFARWVWAEEESPNINHPGFPASGIFVTTKPDFETEFHLEPYDQPNVLLTGDVFTLDQPGNYLDLRFFLPSIGGRTEDNFQATVAFTDGSSTDLITSISDWQASRDYNATEERMAIVRDSWDGYFANGVWPRQIEFELSESEQAKLIESIEFTLVDRLGVAAVSGTSTRPVTPFAIQEIEYDSTSQNVTLTWSSREGEIFAIKYSPDLEDWGGEFDDGIEADAGDTTSKTFDLSAFELGDLGELYFRVEKP